MRPARRTDERRIYAPKRGLAEGAGRVDHSASCMRLRLHYILLLAHYSAAALMHPPRSVPVRCKFSELKSSTEGHYPGGGAWAYLAMHCSAA